MGFKYLVLIALCYFPLLFFGLVRCVKDKVGFVFGLDIPLARAVLTPHFVRRCGFSPEECLPQRLNADWAWRLEVEKQVPQLNNSKSLQYYSLHKFSRIAMVYDHEPKVSCFIPFFNLWFAEIEKGMTGNIRCFDWCLLSVIQLLSFEQLDSGSMFLRFKPYPYTAIIIYKPMLISGKTGSPRHLATNKTKKVVCLLRGRYIEWSLWFNIPEQGANLFWNKLKAIHAALQGAK